MTRIGFVLASPVIDSGASDKDGPCVMVVRVGPSPYAPHMVTSSADSRYYGRFYRRGNYESRIAEEYEVREMLERARRLYEGIEGEIARRGYGDPSSADFATNQYARRLVTRFTHITEAREDAARRVTVLLLPIAPAPSTDATRQNRREWISWLDPNVRRYLPDHGGQFVPGDTLQPTLGGIACLKNLWEHDGVGMRNKGLEEYLLVHFDGTVEIGFSSAVRQMEKAGSVSFVFWGRQILARVWQTINFTNEIRRRLGLTSSYILVFNAKNTAYGVLAGFAHDWVNLDPSVSGLVEFGEEPYCLETNLQIRRELASEDFEEIYAGTWESPPEQIRDLSWELSSAFGLQDPVLLPRET